MKVQLTIIIFLLFSFFTVSSSYSQINNIEQVEPSKFNGKIGTYDIYVELNNINDQIIGWYNYPGKSTKLRLEGSITSNGEIELKEFNYKAIQTGYFEGIIDENNTITGKWSKPDKTKPLPFSVELSNSVSLIQLNSETSVPTDKVVSEEIVGEENSKMFLESKIQGFSKLALWITVFLLVGISILIYLYLRVKKKPHPETKVIVEKQVEVHYVNDSIPNELSISAEKGRIFEDHIIEVFSKKEVNFKLKTRTNDRGVNGKFSESNSNPDLIYSYSARGKTGEIAVECKYRAGYHGTKIYVDKLHKIKNYRTFESKEEIPVFLAIGVGGHPTQPKEKYMIPLNLINDEYIEKESIIHCIQTKEYFYFDTELKKFI